MFSGVLDAAGEEVLVLGAGEEGEDELPILALAGGDEVGEENGGDRSQGGGSAVGEIEEVEVAS